MSDHVSALPVNVSRGKRHIEPGHSSGNSTRCKSGELKSDPQGDFENIEKSFSTSKSHRLVNIYGSLFRATIAISTFGASITFQVIIQQISDEDSNEGDDDHHFDRKTARSFLAIAWALFLIVLGISCFAATILAFNKERLRRGLNQNKRDWYAVWGAVAAGLVIALMLGAFLFSSMAVSAYSEGPGWLAAAFVGLFGIIALVLWIKVCG
jgi:hypothetical protein